MNEKTIKKLKKNKKGITLIALVVTIVVLLILAGITINYVFSEGGLFDTAKNSGNTWQNAQNSDLDALNEVNGMVGNLVNGGTTTPPEPEDTTPPEKATIGEPNKPNPGPNEPIIVNVTLGTEGSDVNITSCKYIYDTTSLNLGTTNSAWESARAFTTNPEDIELTASTEGNYYLHILSVDNAGNKTESISEPINVSSKPVTGVKLNTNSVTLKVGGTAAQATTSLTATIEPSDATNKNVTWGSSDSSVAEVSNNGTITAKDIGTAEITVTTEDENKTASCTVKVIGVSTIKLTDGSTVELTKENFGDHLGKRVANYKTLGGTENVKVGTNTYTVSTTYRLYYVDFDNKFGDGAGTVYLKADYIDNNYALGTDGAEATSKIKNLNPELYKTGVTAPKSTNPNMEAVTWLTDTEKWKGLVTSSPSTGITSSSINYVVGAPSLEMMMDSYNTHYKLTGTTPDTTAIPAAPDTTRRKLFYKYISGDYGYQVGPCASESSKYSSHTSINSIKTDSKIDSMYYPGGSGKKYWLASPRTGARNSLMECSRERQ